MTKKLVIFKNVKNVTFQAFGRKVSIFLPLRGRKRSLSAVVGLKSCIHNVGGKIKIGSASGVIHVIWDISHLTSLIV